MKNLLPAQNLLPADTLGISGSLHCVLCRKPGRRHRDECFLHPLPFIEQRYQRRSDHGLFCDGPSCRDGDIHPQHPDHDRLLQIHGTAVHLTQHRRHHYAFDFSRRHGLLIDVEDHG